MEWLTKEKTELESDLQDLLAQKQNLELRLNQSAEQHQKSIKELNSKLLETAGK